MSGSDEMPQTIPVTISIDAKTRKMLELGMNPQDAPRFVEFGVRPTGAMVRSDGKRLDNGDDYEWLIAGLAWDTEPPVDVFFIECMNSEPRLWVEIWLAHLVPKNSTVYAELRWRPGEGVTVGIHGPIETFRDEEKKARAALNHFVRRVIGHPPRDAALAIQIARWHDEDGLTIPDIAGRQHWSLSPDQYGKLRRSARVTDHIKYGRKLLRTEKPTQ